jgi:hypothetical protein
MSSLKANIYRALKCGKWTFHCGDMIVNIIDVVVVTVEENNVGVAAAV